MDECQDTAEVYMQQQQQQQQPINNDDDDIIENNTTVNNNTSTDNDDDSNDDNNQQGVIVSSSSSTTTTTATTYKSTGHKSAHSSTIKCSICSKTFNNSSALAKHKLIHSTERRYTCQQCAKSFKRQDHLNGHMMTHAEKKPYECQFPNCDKSYCDSRSLRRHYDNFHKSQQQQQHQQQMQDSAILTPGLTPRSAGMTNSNDNSARIIGNESIFNFENIDVKEEGVNVNNNHHNANNNNNIISNIFNNINNNNNNNLNNNNINQIPPSPSLAFSLMQMSPVSPVTNNNNSNVLQQQNNALQQPQQQPQPQQQQNVVNNSGITDFNPFIDEYKPIKCKQCDRRFKNMPALNGHMRLHGGYVKKSESAIDVDPSSATKSNVASRKTTPKHQQQQRHLQQKFEPQSQQLQQNVDQQPHHQQQLQQHTEQQPADISNADKSSHQHLSQLFQEPSNENISTHLKQLQQIDQQKRHPLPQQQPLDNWQQNPLPESQHLQQHPQHRQTIIDLDSQHNFVEIQSHLRNEGSNLSDMICINDKTIDNKSVDVDYAEVGRDCDDINMQLQQQQQLQHIKCCSNFSTINDDLSNIKHYRHHQQQHLGSNDNNNSDNNDDNSGHDLYSDNNYIPADDDDDNGKMSCEIANVLSVASTALQQLDQQNHPQHHHHALQQTNFNLLPTSQHLAKDVDDTNSNNEIKINSLNPSENSVLQNVGNNFKNVVNSMHNVSTVKNIILDDDDDDVIDDDIGDVALIDDDKAIDIIMSLEEDREKQKLQQIICNNSNNNNIGNNISSIIFNTNNNSNSNNLNNVIFNNNDLGNIEKSVNININEFDDLSNKNIFDINYAQPILIQQQQQQLLPQQSIPNQQHLQEHDNVRDIGTLNNCKIGSDNVNLVNDAQLKNNYNIAINSGITISGKIGNFQQVSLSEGEKIQQLLRQQKLRNMQQQQSCQQQQQPLVTVHPFQQEKELQIQLQQQQQQQHLMHRQQQQHLFQHQQQKQLQQQQQKHRQQQQQEPMTPSLVFQRKCSLNHNYPDDDDDDDGYGDNHDDDKCNIRKQTIFIFPSSSLVSSSSATLSLPSSSALIKDSKHEIDEFISMPSHMYSSTLTTLSSVLSLSHNLPSSSSFSLLSSSAYHSSISLSSSLLSHQVIPSSLFQSSSSLFQSSSSLSSSKRLFHGPSGSLPAPPSSSLSTSPYQSSSSSLYHSLSSSIYQSSSSPYQSLSSSSIYQLSSSLSLSLLHQSPSSLISSSSSSSLSCHLSSSSSSSGSSSSSYQPQQEHQLHYRRRVALECHEANSEISNMLLKFKQNDLKPIGANSSDNNMVDNLRALNEDLIQNTATAGNLKGNDRFDKINNGDNDDGDDDDDDEINSCLINDEMNCLRSGQMKLMGDDDDDVNKCQTLMLLDNNIIVTNNNVKSNNNSVGVLDNDVVPIFKSGNIVRQNNNNDNNTNNIHYHNSNNSNDNNNLLGHLMHDSHQKQYCVVNDEFCMETLYSLMNENKIVPTESFGDVVVLQQQSQQLAQQIAQHKPTLRRQVSQHKPTLQHQQQHQLLQQHFATKQLHSSNEQYFQHQLYFQQPQQQNFQHLQQQLHQSQQQQIIILQSTNSNNLISNQNCINQPIEICISQQSLSSPHQQITLPSSLQPQQQQQATLFSQQLTSPPQQQQIFIGYCDDKNNIILSPGCLQLAPVTQNINNTFINVNNNSNIDTSNSYSNISNNNTGNNNNNIIAPIHHDNRPKRKIKPQPLVIPQSANNYICSNNFIAVGTKRPPSPTKHATQARRLKSSHKSPFTPPPWDGRGLGPGHDFYSGNLRPPQSAPPYKPDDRSVPFGNEFDENLLVDCLAEETTSP